MPSKGTGHIAPILHAKILKVTEITSVLKIVK